jgi:tetratricopeptide (TPR) repeat protein
MRVLCLGKCCFSLPALAVIALLTVVSCRDNGGFRKRELSDTGKSVFFTDRRPFDQDLINEDIERLTTGIARSPRDARLLVARGFIYAALTKFAKAIPDFDEAARLDPQVSIESPYGPDKSGVTYLTALAYWQNGSPGKGIDLFSQVLAANPRFDRAFFYRGLARNEVGDRTNAIQDVSAAARLNGDTIYQKALDQLRGVKSDEDIYATYFICFYANRPPENRPFGYVWEIQHEIRKRGKLPC